MIGEPCLFIRFSGCNMWSGRREDKTASVCPFCDTNFLDYQHLTADEIVLKLNGLSTSIKWVIVSGGEPMLQFDQDLCRRIRDSGREICVETNGSIPIPFDVDHISMSPKQSRDRVRQGHCDSLKILYPHGVVKPEDYLEFPAKHKYLQPIADESGVAVSNMRKAINKLYTMPGWRLSPQLHKLIGTE